MTDAEGWIIRTGAVAVALTAIILLLYKGGSVLSVVMAALRDFTGAPAHNGLPAVPGMKQLLNEHTDKLDEHTVSFEQQSSALTEHIKQVHIDTVAVQESLENQNTEMASQGRRLAKVEKELETNSGHSLRDIVVRTEAKADTAIAVGTRNNEKLEEISSLMRGMQSERSETMRAAWKSHLEYTKALQAILPDFDPPTPTWASEYASREDKE